MLTLNEKEIEIPVGITWGFGWARNGGKLGRLFHRALVEGGVEFTSFSHGDMYIEWDFSFEYKGKQFKGYSCTSFEFHRVGVPRLERLGYSYSMRYLDPPTLETALYRVFSALNGERWDTYHVVEGTPIRWY